MWNKILGALAAVGAALSAIFFLLFRQNSKDKKAINEKYKNMSDNLDALKAADHAEKELKKENEKLIQKAHGNNNLNAFNACNDLLSK